MSQPVWKLLAKLQDHDEVDYSGVFVFVDETGVYDPEIEILDSPESDDGEWMAWRCDIPQLKQLPSGELIPVDYEPTWPHGAGNYVEWFDKDLPAVAEFSDRTDAELRAALCGDDIIERAFAYMAIGDYHGRDNLDHYPLAWNDRVEVEKRYSAEKYRL